VKLPFADPWRTYTHAFERYAWTCRGSAASRRDHLDVSWDIVKDIQKRHLVKVFQAEAQEPEGMPSTSWPSAKATLLLLGPQPSQRQVVLPEDGKGGEALARLETVAWFGGQGAGRHEPTSAPSATTLRPSTSSIISVIKLFNEKLSAFRRELYRELTCDHERKLLRGPVAASEEPRELG
jgi:hypothetical protein